tara:strand:+ start:377 stop:514 length:138 start_codon:yes stop_codon:yes gene_type:complete
MKNKPVIKIGLEIDLGIKLTERDIEVSLLELKRRVGPPLIHFKKK